MSLSDDVRSLADGVLHSLAEARDFYLHTQQAWRVVQQVAQEGRSVGIVDRLSGQELSASELEGLAQRYVTGPLAETTFKGLSTLLEDWILGLARLWLKAYPKQLDAAAGDSGGLGRSRRREEIQVPLSEILAAPDREAILASLAERIVRDLAYERPAQWFRFLDNRVNLGCPDEARRAALCEIKAARDALEHSRGAVGRDYVEKSGTASRYVVDDVIQIEETYLLECFALLKETVEEMCAAAIRRGAG